MSGPDRSTHNSALQGDAALVRAVGSFALTAAVINIIVGAGIFKMPATLSAQMGAAAPLALIAGALAIIPIALCFAAVGSRAAATGSPYTYAGAVFGPFAGFVAGALMWISNVASSAGVAAALSVQVAGLLPLFAEPAARAMLLIGVYLVVFAFNAFGVKLGARAIAVLATLKLTPLFLLAGVGLFFVDWHQVSWTDVPSWSAMGTSMVLVMFAYSGMETALIPSGEVRDVSKSVPRATMAAILLVVLLYLGLQVVTQGVLGAGLGQSGVPLADTAGALWSPGRVLLLLTACVSMFGFLMGNLLGSSRLLFALGRDGYLPGAFGAVSAAHRVPLLAIATHAGLGCVLALGGSFDALALISGGGNCLVYIVVCAAAWRAQRVDLRERGEPFVLPGGAAIPLLSVLAMTAIVATLTAKEWLALGGALLLLIAVYGALRMTRPRQLP
ncbi:APA family basic amino acid/polyamine antiporter [Luteimonas cucumeris]|uniref:Arginine/agmatine antiporter n=1 Tax=Luteimonas cucumeris TaxID=985012 RepID=A0A562KUT2_9GAMM|nr:APC family permease [Luteimonas cucumeris]TWH99171.1 APA family basic amino acid/polyamine antiporter [Luteimonas cucumeris]